MAQVFLIAPGELMVSRDRLATIETYLGSCVGVALYDHLAAVGGLIHVLLPDSTPERVLEVPSRYASSGIPLLVREMEAIGGQKERFKAWMAGGAEMLPDEKGRISLDIGRRNILAVTGILEAAKIPVVAYEVGGHFGKRLVLHMDKGSAEISSIKNVTLSSKDLEKKAPSPSEADIVKSIQDLSPFAAVATGLFEMIDDEDIAFSRLRDEIYKDQALTANILKLCNSAYFGIPRQILKLSQAITLLGSKRLKKIILTALVKPIYESGSNNYFLRRRDLFRHALGCALSAELLAGRIGFHDPELAFVAGLIHDIGKVILGQYAPGQFNRLIDAVTNEKKTFEEAEKEAFGYSHAQVGGWVAEAWKLPQVLCEAISFHHNPAMATVGGTLTSLIHVADTICNILGLGCGRAGFVNRISSEVTSLIPLSAEQIEDTIIFLPAMLKKVEDAY